jgi:poly-gamma-glutamate capsule biosynthesis protein CapA/YwtB (metallophosphatase superfamily)
LNSDSGPLSIAFGGDCLLTRSLSVFREPRFLELQRLITGCDAGFVNLDASVHTYLDGPHAQHDGGGTYMTTEPRLLQDLRWMGINLLSCGSSHADDYGWDGIMETMRHLDAAGIAHAGSGRHLAEARSPAYLDTASGRIALVAATLQFNPAARAGAQRPDTAGHPGVNGIRNHPEYVVSPEVLDLARRLGAAVGVDAARRREQFQGAPGGDDEPEDRYELFGRLFHGGAEGAEPELRWRGNAQDIEATLRQVECARSMADLVIFSLHCHQQGGRGLLTAARRSEIGEPCDLAVDIAHRAIDAGADVFVGHGPQIPMGIEMYRGKPILHGLGTFVFQLETVRFLPQEAYDRYGLGTEASPADFIEARYQGDTRGHTADRAQWEQALSICRFEGGALRAITLHPLDLGFRQARTRRGRPVLAEGEVAARVIGRVTELCARYGVRVEERGGVATVLVG